MITAETKRFALAAALTLLAALVASAGIFVALRQKERAYTAEREVQATRAAAREDAATATRLLADTARDRAELESYMLTEDSVVNFLSRIETLARSRGAAAKTDSIAVEPIEGSEIFETFTVSVEAVGSFSMVTDLLPLFESLPYQLAVRETKIERADEESETLWRGVYRLAVTKYTYMRTP